MVELPPITFGAMAHVGADSGDARVALMQRAIEEGITAIDTAPLYGFGHSEELVGRAVAGVSGPVKVLSKVGLRWDPDARGEVLFETPERRVVRDSRPEQVRRDVEESLERLRLERLDLVQVHHPDWQTPLNETFGALGDLHREGRVGAVGASNFGVEQLEEAQRGLGDVPLFSTQERYNLIYRDVEREVLPYCREHGVGLLTYSPLAQGLLAGKLLMGGRMTRNDFRSADPSFHPKNVARVHAAMRAGLDPIALERSAPLASVALAWLSHQPGVRSVIAGARDEQQLEGLLKAQRMELTRLELKGIRAAFDQRPIDRTLARDGLLQRAIGFVRRRLP